MPSSRRPFTPDEPFETGRFLYVTAGTNQKRSFLLGQPRKQVLLESLDLNSLKWSWRVVAWAILDNHYHAVLSPPTPDAGRLAWIIQSAHSYSAWNIRQEEPSIRTRIWWNFWEATIPDRDALLQAIGYIHHNASLHGQADRSAETPESSLGDHLRAGLGRWETLHEAYRPASLDPLDAF
jgi:REP element-mobilizing transposase RayT